MMMNDDNVVLKFKAAIHILFVFGQVVKTPILYSPKIETHATLCMF